MRDLLGRLRAALTPQALALLAIGALVLFGSAFAGEDSTQTALEKRIGKALSSVEGAGHVQVVIHTREAAQGGSALSSSSGAQQVPLGAVAVAQGADDPVVYLELQQALCALLGLPASAVSVVTGGK